MAQASSNYRSTQGLHTMTVWKFEAVLFVYNDVAQVGYQLDRSFSKNKMRCGSLGPKASIELLRLTISTGGAPGHSVHSTPQACATWFSACIKPYGTASGGATRLQRKGFGMSCALPVAPSAYSEHQYAEPLQYSAECTFCTGFPFLLC